ncbi:four helix bundle protein [Algoriphagus zhangzhouensis]|uniref:Four helix bundle protein n=1 Tax=Algoriphagus zhangzhouensis TaxID=1073327 RepID=A0A1M7ZKF1_9BACT|nr:four helix bundle protein [Algoriphagus zhangzhouensis]TDY42861.1 four helix bundle protein [Algoriphagus zhangzhouensis]SHO65374.1 four helix bundle protein [Algoriphagus zhangzhouensis]
MDTFEDLKCWQSAYSLKNRIRLEILSRIPDSEKYDLKAQLLRAARSATANIAEGWGRFHFLDSRKFYYNSRGSLGEILDHLIEAKDCHYIEIDLFSSVQNDCITSLKILNGYIRYLTEKNKPSSKI